MRSSPARTVVAVAVAVLLAAAGVTVSLSVDAADGGPLAGPVLSAVVVLALTAVGAVVSAARPDNAVGWLLLAGGVLWAVGNAGTDAAYRGIVAAPGSVPGAALGAVAGSVVRGLGWWVLVLGVPVLFPDGRLAGPRWRWLTWLLAVVLGCSAVGALFAGDANLPELRWHNPIALFEPIPDLLSLLALVLAGVVTVGAVLQLRARWRRGGPLERQQLLLFAVAVVPPVAAGPLSLAGWTGGWLFSLAVLALAGTIGIAVLAKGLYDLRTAANRTLVWLTLSVLVVGIYALVIVGVSGLLHVDRAVWLPWLAAAVVALAFAPLRDAAQRAVNRLTFGRWDEPYAVLAALGQQVEATRDVDGLIADVVAELERGLGLRDVALLDDQGRVLAGSASAAGTQATTLTAYGESIGTVRYRVPQPGLLPRDRQLLDDLAGHLGGLLHAHRLTAELQRARERLVLAREEERRRLRRDLHDGLGPALASHLLQLDVIAGRLGGAPVLAAVQVLRQDVRTTILDVRRVVEGLRPPALDELGLAGAVTQAAHRLTAGSGTCVEVAVGELPPLPAAVEVAAFRIVTEAVTNVVRHAGAARCAVSLTVDGSVLRIEVHDDGGGSSPSGVPGHGLDTMRERAEELRGRLQVQRGEGNTVVAELPLPGDIVADRALAAVRT